MSGPRALPLLLGLVACSALDADSQQTVRVTLLGTTDVHGHLLPYDYATDGTERGGLARVATLVDSIRRADEHVLLFDSGDLLQGTPLDEYQARVSADPVHPVIAAMNALGYAASAVGNHEYNYGIPFLERTLAAAGFPFLAANIYDAVSGETVFPPFIIRETGGVRVGILGFTTPGVAIWDRSHVEGRLRFADIVESARRWLPELERQRPDLIVAIAHSGIGPGSSYAPESGVPEENAIHRLATELPAIDLVFAGHSHDRVEGSRIGEALVVQAGRFARVLAVVHVTLRRIAGRWSILKKRSFTIPTGETAPSAVVANIVRDAHERTVAWLREPIGFTPDRWTAARARFEDTPIADLITEVQRQAAGADLASTAVFDPSASFGPGAVSRRDILGLYIYPNTLKAVRISGADLRAYLEWSARYFTGFPGEPLINDSVPGYNFDVVSGVSYRIDLSRPAGRRITELRFRGRPVAPADSFTLALNNYRQSGGGGAEMVARAPVVYSGEESISQLIIDWVRGRDTLRFTDVFEENWRLLPEAAVQQVSREAGAVATH
ncbi:MAG: bifunctional metallophosphatase/5'-nucleotidase [Gemmatimonadota bacterium]